MRSHAQRQAEKDTLALERAVALADLWYYLTAVLHLDLVERVHRRLVDALEAGDWYELLVLFARGFFKTSIVAGYVSWRIAKDRNFTGLAVAFNAEKFGAQLVGLVQAHLESRDVVRLFGAFRDPALEWTKTSFVVSGRTRAIRDYTFSAVGRENFKPGGHYDLVWFDDLEDGDTVASESERARTDKIDEDAYSMADKPGAKRITTGTYWAYDDLYVRKERAYGFYAVSEANREPERVSGTYSDDHKGLFLYQPFHHADGSCAFAERYDEDFYQFRRTKMSARHHSAQYDLKPVAVADAKWGEGDFVYVDAEPPKGDEWEGLDLARSRSRDSDYIGLVRVKVYDFLWYVTLVEKLKLDGDELLEKLFAHHAEKPRMRFIIEEDGYGAGLKGRLNDWMRKRRTWIPITWINAHNRMGKDDRTLATQEMFKTHSVHFVRGRGCELLEGELLHFGASGHDDVRDAWSNVAEVVTQRPGELPEKPRGKYPWNVEAPLDEMPDGFFRGEESDADDPFWGLPGDQLDWRSA